MVALWSAMTPVSAWTDSRPTRPVQRFAGMRQTPPKNKSCSCSCPRQIHVPRRRSCPSLSAGAVPPASLSKPPQAGSRPVRADGPLLAQHPGDKDLANGEAWL